MKDTKPEEFIELKSLISPLGKAIDTVTLDKKILRRVILFFFAVKSTKGICLWNCAMDTTSRDGPRKKTTHTQPYKSMSMVGIQNRPPFDIGLNKA